jgi:hypothetical protein
MCPNSLLVHVNVLTPGSGQRDVSALCIHHLLACHLLVGLRLLGDGAQELANFVVRERIDRSA